MLLKSHLGIFVKIIKFTLNDNLNIEKLGFNLRLYYADITIQNILIVLENNYFGCPLFFIIDASTSQFLIILVSQINNHNLHKSLLPLPISFFILFQCFL